MSWGFSTRGKAAPGAPQGPHTPAVPPLLRLDAAAGGAAARHARSYSHARAGPAGRGAEGAAGRCRLLSVVYRDVMLLCFVRRVALHRFPRESSQPIALPAPSRRQYTGRSSSRLSALSSTRRQKMTAERTPSTPIAAWVCTPRTPRREAIRRTGFDDYSEVATGVVVARFVVAVDQTRGDDAVAAEQARWR